MPESGATYDGRAPSIAFRPQRDLVFRMDPSFYRADALYVEDLLRQRFECFALGDMASLAQGDTPRTRYHERRLPDGEVAFLDIGDVLATGIDFTGCSFILSSQHQRLARTALREGDVLLIRSGVGSLGRSTVALRLPGSTNVTSHIDVIRPDGVSPYFLDIFLKTRFGQSQICRRKSGVCGREEIPIVQLRTILVPLLARPGDELDIALATGYLEMAAHHHSAFRARMSAIEARSRGDEAGAGRGAAESARLWSFAQAKLASLVQELDRLIDGGADCACS